MVSFEQSSYEVLEDVGLDNLALRVCISILQTGPVEERTVRLKTVSGTAQGLYYISSWKCSNIKLLPAYVSRMHIHE